MFLLERASSAAAFAKPFGGGVNIASLCAKVRSRREKITWNGQRRLLPSLSRELFGAAMRYPAVRWAVSRVSRVPPTRPRGIVFLCGCYNSGTTIVREMLGSHRSIASMPREGVVYTDRLTSFSNGLWTRFWPSRAAVEEATRLDFKNLRAEDLLRDWSWWIDENKFLLEKSITNSARMVDLQSLFPGSFFIVMRREAVGVTEGIVRRTRSIGSSDGETRPTISDALEQWKLCNAMIDEQIPQLERVLEVNYEALVRDPEAEVREIFDFLGISVSVEKFDGGVRIDGIEWNLFDGNARSRQILASQGRSGQ